MKIKELTAVLKDAERITLLIGDMVYDYSPRDPFLVDAFGGYKVAAVHGSSNTGNVCTEYEIEIEMQPVKEV